MSQKKTFMPKPITLSTDKVTLCPLSTEHLNAFYRAGSFPEIWRWSLPDKCTSLETTKAWLAYSQKMTDKGEHLPFAIFDNASNKFVGSSRYCSIKHEDRNIEIGFSFITPEFQRSYINTHAKYCLLKHAFEDLKAIRVEFKTHVENTKSRNAIGRLGAQFEGILRNQRILSDGNFRHTAIFSIIDTEWPKIKAQLTAKMEKVYEPIK